MNFSNELRTVQQILRLGELRQVRTSPADTMYAITGRRLYLLGDIDGRFRPRSNPYDLHAFGKPHPKDPLAEKLQGVWAQPVKGITAYGYAVEVAEEHWSLDTADSFTQSYAAVTFEFSRGDLRAIRTDFPALDLPLLVSTLELTNNGGRALDLRVSFATRFDLVDAWFTKLAEHRNTAQTVAVEAGRLVARAEAAPEHWAAAAAGLQTPEQVERHGIDSGSLVYGVRLKPGGQVRLVFGMAVVSDGGADAALQVLDALPNWERLLAEREALYARVIDDAPRLVTPDASFNTAFPIACANLQMLEAENGGKGREIMGRYFYAGLEMFPFWFSCDGAYSLTGLMIAGLRASALNHARIGIITQDRGRVPHQISPSGRVAFAGNAEETQLWVMGVWDAYRWTGDKDFLRALYPGAKLGLLEYVLGTIDPDGDGYPDGPGMVEVEGMGPEKLDSAAYTWSALVALANMAEVLDDAEIAHLARTRAEAIVKRFDADWWDEAGGMYAMSLTSENQPYPVPHWAVIVPLEVGLATDEHAARTFETLRSDYLNQWGLKHTVGDDERVWTLPTALLSKAAYRYGEPDMGLQMLRHVAETLDTGSIGLFHELIPEGACIVQLWSAASLLRGVVEDLFGVVVDAGAHSLTVAPRLPARWENAALENLRFGNHRVSLRVEQGRVLVYHEEGPVALSINGKWVESGQKTVIDFGE